MVNDSKKSNMTAEELKEIRKTLGISQVKFAEILGVKKTTYCFWEQRRNPIGEWAANLIRLTAIEFEKRR